jgi:hypothetical protein
MINRQILEYAKQEGVEKGRKVRTDCTWKRGHPLKGQSREKTPHH